MFRHWVKELIVFLIMALPQAHYLLPIITWSTLYFQFTNVFIIQFSFTLPTTNLLEGFWALVYQAEVYKGVLLSVQEFLV